MIEIALYQPDIAQGERYSGQGTNPVPVSFVSIPVAAIQTFDNCNTPGASRLNTRLEFQFCLPDSSEDAVVLRYPAGTIFAGEFGSNESSTAFEEESLREEFVIVAPDCNLRGAIDVAHRFRRAVASRSHREAEELPPLTVSVGVATAADGAEVDPQALLGRADQALYQAKIAGRDAVWYWCGRAQSPRPAAEASSLRSA